MPKITNPFSSPGVLEAVKSCSASLNKRFAAYRGDFFGFFLHILKLVGVANLLGQLIVV